MRRILDILRRLPRPGLRFQVMGFTAVLTVLLVFALGFVWLSLLERNFVRMKYAAGRTVASALQSAIQVQWQDRNELVSVRPDQKNLQAILQTYVNNMQLVNMFIVDPEHRVLAHVRQEQIGQPYDDEDIAKALADKSIVQRYESARGGVSLREGDEVDVTSPIFLGNRVVGAVRITLSVDDAADASAGARRVLVLYMILTGVLTSVLGSLFMLRLIIRPLAELASATERIPEGSLGDWPLARKPSEIGVVAAALQRLYETLKERDKEVERQKANLQRAAERLVRMEGQVAQQDRLAYVGRVAAGVAHEVGNPLGAIYNYLGVLASMSETRPDERDIIRRIEREVERIDRIMRELLDFSRRPPDTLTVVHPEAFLRECVAIMKDQRQLDSVDVEVRAGEGVPDITLDAGQLKQVVLNALANARDAMSGLGRIVITVEAVRYTETLLLESLLGGPAPEETGVAFTDLARRGIVISSKPAFYNGEELLAMHIRDEGPGLIPDKTQRVFEPFFTTKEVGKGTGLGLAVSQRIIEGFGGVIRFQSRKQSGKGESGSVLSIYIPLRAGMENEKYEG